MTPEPCPDRHLLALSGADVINFFHGMVSNDVLPLAKADGLVYAALLTPQGKYLADFFIGRLSGQYFLDLPAAIAASTQQRLSLYRLRSDVHFAPLDWAVGRGLGPAPLGSLLDPRHSALGWRSYGLPIAPGGIDWQAIRVSHIIPETGIELIANESYLLETGFERLHGVDFRKGCYVGQEVTARMKHKTELRKGLAQVEIEGFAAAGTPLMTQDGKEAGTLFSQIPGLAIAYLRFERATGPLRAGSALVKWTGTAD
jgi:folate-binding protein YgfZ